MKNRKFVAAVRSTLAPHTGDAYATCYSKSALLAQLANLVESSLEPSEGYDNMRLLIDSFLDGHDLDVPAQTYEDLVTLANKICAYGVTPIMVFDRETATVVNPVAKGDRVRLTGDYETDIVYCVSLDRAAKLIKKECKAGRGQHVIAMSYAAAVGATLLRAQKVEEPKATAVEAQVAGSVPA